MGKRTGSWQLITVKDFDQKFLNDLIYGQVLGFLKDGTMHYWKVARIDREHGKWWIKPWQIYSPDEFNKMEAERISKP